MSFYETAIDSISALQVHYSSKVPGSCESPPVDVTTRHLVFKSSNEGHVPSLTLYPRYHSVEQHADSGSSSIFARSSAPTFSDYTLEGSQSQTEILALHPSLSDLFES